jgi:PAS domain S-box-containing protein
MNVGHHRVTSKIAIHRGCFVTCPADGFSILRRRAQTLRTGGHANFQGLIVISSGHRGPAACQSPAVPWPLRATGPMLDWFQKLKVSHKLMLISIFFVLPDSVMLYLFITAINDNIHFAEMESKGNEYQRPLEELLELLPQHRLLAFQALSGETKSRAQLDKKQREINAAFQRLEEVDARIGPDLQFTDEGLAKRHREHFRVATVWGEWRECRAQLAKLDEAGIAERHQHLIADIRTMITHSGDTSNLILDPDLDSYYLMDTTLLALPQAQDRLANVMATGDAVLRRGQVTFQDRQEFATYASLLRQQDLDRITLSLQTSLREDQNFYGINSSLQERIPPALQEYIEAMDRFIRLTQRFVYLEGVDVTAEEYLAAGAKARNASFNLWRIADEEVDRLLQIRIVAYQHRRAKSLLVAAGALLAAIGFVTFITRSISGPLRQQADELREANEALQVEIAERKRIEAALRTAEEQYRGIFENAVEGIFQTTADGQYLVANPTLARMYGYGSVEELKVGMRDIAGQLYVKPDRRAEFRRIIAEQGEAQGFESQIRRKDGSIIWISEHARAAHDASGALLYYEGTVQDVTARKRHEEEVEKLNRQLMDASRRAGMAEVATGVLHNVGNVLNSVNVSALLITDRLGKSRVAHLGHVSTALKDNAADLGKFITEDPRGSKLPSFIASLAERLSNEQAELLREAEDLSKNITHIKDIVAVQQNYAKVSGVVEVLPACALVEDALQMNDAAFDRHRIEIVRKFEDDSMVRVDKHKVLQILVNVLRNAKYAVSETLREEKRIVVNVTRNGNDRVRISVADNGIGIPTENLSRIFAHGFTTKVNGHGFGLHSAALAAKEVGGSLVAESDGPDLGATFILELPLDVSPTTL